MFRFKLDFLLRYRRQKEELAMYELAQRVRDANAVEMELQDINDRAAELATSIRVLGQAGVSAPVFNLYRQYQDHLRKQGLITEQRLVQAEAAVEKQRRALVAISVDRQVIERYKERQQEAFQTSEALVQQKNLDELASMREARKANEPR